MAGALMVDEASLPPAFRQGLAAIRRQVTDAAVVAVQDNFAYIDIGLLSADDLALYTQDEARLFARAPLTFPHAAPYGLVTAPFLTRRDGRAVERQHAGHATAAPVGAALGLTALGFWSWDWSHMPLRRAEDLAAIVAWAHKRIRQG
jgi:hypothetical protein